MLVKFNYVFLLKKEEKEVDKSVIETVCCLLWISGCNCIFLLVGNWKLSHRTGTVGASVRQQLDSYLFFSFPFLVEKRRRGCTHRCREMDVLSLP